MDWLADNYLVILAIVVLIAGVCLGQKRAKDWLLYAVMIAEKDLGGGTGKLKLRQVYDMFITKFPFVAMFVPFSIFSGWVDTVLVEMKSILNTNRDIAEYVNSNETKQYSFTVSDKSEDDRR